MKLDEKFFRCAIEGIVESGDTDIFPYPFELYFLRDSIEKISTELATFDISQYHPFSLVESLIPKSKFGFRVAHQPYPIDSVIYTALVLVIADDIENKRDAAIGNRAFAYRKNSGLDKSFFTENRTYKNWLNSFVGKIFLDGYDFVVETDISDFYARIYRHRLENILSTLTSETKIVKKIEAFISDWRSAQSFGIPVGSNASRLLAEASLHDTDMALIAEGIEHTRFVDDFRLFIRKGQDPYAALAFLAQHLSANEGLSLNSQKTKVLKWSEFVASSSDESSEDDHSKEEFATEKLFRAAYGQDEIDEDALEALMLKDLDQELEGMLTQPYWEMGKIRIVLHAMRLVAKPLIAKYIREHLKVLLPFARDICLLIEDFMAQGIEGFENMSSEIVDLILQPAAQPLDCARAWLLELGTRNLVKFNNADIRRLDALTGTLDLRQIHLIRWRACDINYFRSKKTRLHEIQVWAQPSFIFGARCLPKDEYSHWIRSIKSRLNFPVGKLFAEWCLETYGSDPFYKNPSARSKSLSVEAGEKPF
ncbi:MAG: RNA-directed DNA polymerase [Alphaproteobacteria bacterium]|nr:RNA-directed DNA polymerase [Alphaproteobacteria bacterium]